MSRLLNGQNLGNSLIELGKYRGRFCGCGLKKIIL
jgi:hypothetical protein